MSLQNVRGTHDLLPEDCARQRNVVEVARRAAEVYGFKEMATPIFEFSEVFKKTLGDTSDIVGKEMYSFTDRGGEELTLRPEGTAGVARAFLSQGLSQKLPLKLFYQGPMFRYERPQKGRQRQFHQLGVELLGVRNAWGDVECIALAAEILKRLQISQVRLEINSIGDIDSRKAYRDKLTAYLEKFESSLSKDSQQRLRTNPMRILDSKDENDQKIVQDAPLLADSLTDASREVFEKIREGLDRYGLKYDINPFLVRGLDYYNDLVFEFKTSALGAQDAVLSGGRYDGLVRMMGGPDTAGVGWAAGIERLCLLSPIVPQAVEPVVIVPIHADCEADAFEIAQTLRQKDIPAEVGYSGNLSKRMKKANQIGADFAVLIGPDELKDQMCTLKNLKEGTQENVAIDRLAEKLAHKANGKN